MRYCLLASLTSLVLMVASYAQTTPPCRTKSDASESTELTQRTLQYEVLLGSELSPTLAMCVDEELRNAWMLPAKSESELSARAIERVRRRLEICQAGAVSQIKDLRLAAEIRQGMEAQLKAAHSLELAKNSARNCLGKSQTQDIYKDCMAVALPAAMSEFQWPRWLTLFERRTSLVALGSVGN